MPYTLNEYKASSEKALDLNVIDEFRKSSWLMENITFDDGANPNAGGRAWVYQYDRVTTMPTAAPRAVNADYAPQEAKTTAQLVECKIFGGAFEVDRTQIQTARYGDRIAFQLGQKIQATRALFNDLVVNGDAAVNALQFDGLAVALAGSTTEKSKNIDLSTAANLDSNYKAFLDEMFDFLALLDGQPTALLMNRTMHSRLRSIAMRAGFHTQSEDAFGRMVNQFDGIPFVDLGDKPGTSSPIIPVENRNLDGSVDANGDPTYSANEQNLTDIYAVRLGLDGVHAVSPAGQEAFLRTYLPDLALPGAVKKGEVEMVSTLALKASRAAGRLRDIKVS